MARTVTVEARGACDENHPHDAFMEALALWDDARAHRLAARCRDCSGLVPASCCLWFGFPAGTTYAEAARRVLRRTSRSPFNSLAWH
jgi:hypothetical protein